MNPIKQLFFSVSLYSFLRRCDVAQRSRLILKIKKSICFDDILRLDILCNLSTDKYSLGNYRTKNLSNKDFIQLQGALINLFTLQKIQEKFEIQEITGLNVSSSNIKNHISMEDFVEHDCRRYFEINIEYFHKNLNHPGIHIIHDPNTLDHFFLCGWNPTLFLVNGKDGSHHFASIRYIANKLNISFHLNGLLKLVYINEHALSEFNKEFSVFLLTNYDHLEFEKLLEFYKLPYLLLFNPKYLPQHSCLLFFKRSDWKLFNFQEKLMSKSLTNFNCELERYLILQQENKIFHKYKIKHTY